MSERNQTNRWRCTVTGCNPKLIGEIAAIQHRNETEHRIAKWPIRSVDGKKKALIRNKTGYYDQYNVGHKSPGARGLIRPGYTYDDLGNEYGDHPFSPEALGQD